MPRVYGLDGRAAKRLTGLLARDDRRRHNPGLPGPRNPLYPYGDGGGGKVEFFKITAQISAATWSGGVPTAWGTGTGFKITGLNTVDSTGTTIKSKYPDLISVTSGKAKIVSAEYDGSDWWLITPNCTEVSAT